MVSDDRALMLADEGHAFLEVHVREGMDHALVHRGDELHEPQAPGLVGKPGEMRVSELLCVPLAQEQAVNLSAIAEGQRLRAMRRAYYKRIVVRRRHPSKFVLASRPL